MKFTLASTLALGTLATAAPATNLTTRAQAPQGAINFFSRWDCSNPCVETGYCLNGDATKGNLKGSNNDWVGWDSGCWDRPAGTRSLNLRINNGHRFTGIDKSCEQWKQDNFQAYSFPLKAGPWKSDGMCNVFPGELLKAVVYHWENPSSWTA